MASLDDAQRLTAAMAELNVLESTCIADISTANAEAAEAEQLWKRAQYRDYEVQQKRNQDILSIKARRRKLASLFTTAAEDPEAMESMQDLLAPLGKQWHRCRPSQELVADSAVLPHAMAVCQQALRFLRFPNADM